MKNEFFNREHDNGDVICQMCVWHESGDSSVGLQSGCTNDALYDDNDNLIQEKVDLILECLSNPKHCILFEINPKYANKKGIIIDDNNEYSKIVEMLGGDFITINTNSSTYINPFEISYVTKEDIKNKIREVESISKSCGRGSYNKNNALECLKEILEKNKLTLTPEEVEEIISEFE